MRNQSAAKLVEAGVTLRTAFCGPCFGAGDVPSHNGLSLRHTTRNFPNREGSKPGEGQVSGVALMDARSIAATAANGGKITPATDIDFDTEFLDYILAVRVVKDIDEAIEHIRKYSTGHSEAIVTENKQTADVFVKGVDSSSVYVNVSTRFTDGGEFGLGCEMGISTQKLHARGPMGLMELNTYKYVINGNGQVR